MELYKFCFFDSQDFEFFRTPDFVGSSYLILVAAPYRAAKEEVDSQLFSLSILERPPSEKNNLVAATEITQLAQNLAAKIESDATCKAIFDLRLNRSDWNYTHLQSLAVDPLNLPPEIVRAKKLPRIFYSSKDKKGSSWLPLFPGT